MFERKRWKLVKSEVHFAYGKRGGEIRYGLFAAGVTFLREQDERDRGERSKQKRKRKRDGERERDKGNTGLASTQFPSLASNFRRIPPFILAQQARSTSTPHYIRTFLYLSH